MRHMAMVGVFLAVMLTMTGIAAAEDPIIIYGYITDADGNPVDGASVEILKNNSGLWNSINGPKTTDSNGFYITGELSLPDTIRRNDSYRMLLNGNFVQEKRIEGSDWNCVPLSHCGVIFSYQWNYQIPEFPTIALPIVSVIGLLLIFRKRTN